MSNETFNAEIMKTETEYLNDLISEVEIVFQGFNYGVSATVEMSPGTWLTFKKKGKSWMFLVKNQEGEDRPLLESPRETRILATEWFRILHEQLEKNMQSEIVRVRAASASIRSFLSSLETK